MAKSIENEIAVLIQQSDDIARQVRLENWDSVGILTQERQQALEHFFKKTISVCHVDSVKKMIQAILSSDHELVNFIESEKKKTFNTFAHLKNNSKAKQTYKHIASLNPS